MLVIIADDLTGALDTAAPFAARGLYTEIALTNEAVTGALALKPDVLSINLASREKPACEAYKTMRELMTYLPPAVRLFKKVDSRLKGNISAELDAIEYRRALVAPAIPAFGRFVRNGHVDGFGVETPICVADALGRHAERSTIAEAGTPEDLLSALDDCEGNGIDLLVGARGLAEALADRMTHFAKAELVTPPAGQGLFVIGSHDRITDAQVEQLRQLQDVAYLPAPNGIVEPKGLLSSPAILVQATTGPSTLRPEEVAHNLAQSVHPVLTSGARTMLLCGGATAEAVLATMGVTSFQLKGECMPGLGLAYANGQCIILKSGGFGEPDTLKKLAEQLFDGRN
ncbi:four-carbon acid sugar kinase family protein [uncultured Agrobacterium sp.]|uniref:four-carbon acid sugar kinase family protein n=1 Tax=uncultured Agrobacterium sp. TaxID=157277 RepID=UPI0025ED4CC3|nr:four-carbon acid sugar kinase family protein [uncultured Agrobacterium sp.]